MGVVSPSNNTDIIKKGLINFTHFLGLGQFKKGVYFWRIDIYISKRSTFIHFSESETSNQDDNHAQKKRVYYWGKEEPPHLHT